MSYAHGTLPGLKDMFAEIERSRVMRDLLKDKAICEAASAGPWKAHGQINRNMAVISDRGNILEVVSSESKEEDAQFIAAAHEGWPHAIDRAIAAEKENAELRKRVAFLENYLKEKHGITIEPLSVAEICPRCKVRPKSSKLSLCTPCFTSKA